MKIQIDESTDYVMKIINAIFISPPYRLLIPEYRAVIECLLSYIDNLRGLNENYAVLQPFNIVHLLNERGFPHPALETNNAEYNKEHIKYHGYKTVSHPTPATAPQPINMAHWNPLPPGPSTSSPIPSVYMRALASAAPARSSAPVSIPTNEEEVEETINHREIILISRNRGGKPKRNQFRR
jgi:hypothetical protein